MKYHFISGLPRSGSTLLSAILKQNPRLHADITSPVQELSWTILSKLSGNSENGILVDADARKRLILGIFNSYYEGLDIVFDTNRAWCGNMGMLAELFPESKIICMVRDVRWVMDSVERISQNNPFYLSSIFGTNTQTTVYGRIGAVANGAGLVGFALNALREAYFGPYSDRLIIINYDDLVKHPDIVIKKLYKALGLEPFKHNFNNVAFKSEAFDRFLNTPDLHTVSRKVEFKEVPTILPTNLFNQFVNDLAWLNMPSKAVKINGNN